jgi:hypothetical protein
MEVDSEGLGKILAELNSLKQILFSLPVLTELKWSLLDVYVFYIFVTMTLTQWPLGLGCCSKHAQTNVKSYFIFEVGFERKRRGNNCMFLNFHQKYIVV